MDKEAAGKPYTDQQIGAFVRDIATALEDKRALDIEVLHVRRLTSIADYFVVCTGTSNTHIRTLSEEVERLMETKYGVRPLHIEGYETASWVVVDFGAIVVHVFHKEARQFYSLERIWADAPKYREEPKAAKAEAPKTDGDRHE